MGSIAQAKTNLSEEWKHLQRQWYRTAEVWNDTARSRFEKDMWQEYEHIFPEALRVIEELSSVVAKARKEVK